MKPEHTRQLVRRSMLLATATLALGCAGSGPVHVSQRSPGSHRVVAPHSKS